uniref:Uncharacterized protein n=1 Tax=Avena sativa TaxID=4498 RepID=A0ACD5TCZ5_AVESA
MAELGGMLAAAILKVVGDQIGSAIGGQITLQKNFDEDLKKMKMALESVEAVLKAAERRSITDESTRLWLKRLKDFMYVISDMMDESESARKCCFKKYLAMMIPCLTIGPKITMANKMEKMRKDLELITDQHKDFKLTEGPNANEPKVIDTRETSSIMETQIVGRADDKEKILAYLFERMIEDITILPIYGIGGLGKTTLAKMVYNSSQFKEYYQVWIYVSQTFDLKNIGNSIITQLSEKEKESEYTEIQMIHKALQKLLADKKILIVLDDLWEGEDFHLENLTDMIKVGKGSKVVVIITTRDEGIAKKICTIKPYKLSPLSDDMCWSIIKQKSAFESRGGGEQFEEIGKTIAMKCGGVALAAKSIGHTLQYIKFSEWESLRDSNIWTLHSLKDMSSTQVLASLKLSYSILPSYLKLCFAYCAIYPKGHKIVKDELIHQWVSLGFSTWQLGERYIGHLLGLCFLEHSNSQSNIELYYEDITLLTMHDLVHDLARAAMDDEILVVSKDDNVEGNCYHYALLDDCSKPLISELSKIRSLRFMKCDKIKLHDAAFSPANSLRVLDLSECIIHKLPDSIGVLKQLRYLKAPGVQHTTIPDSITKLSKLMYLDIHGSTAIVELPESIGDTEGLVYLNLSGCSELAKLPESFRRLQKLVHLDLSNCSCVQGISVLLGNLTQLQYLDLTYCPNIGELPEALGGLSKLQYLNLSFNSYLKGCKEADVLGALTNLEYLNLSSEGCGLKKLPDALGRFIQLKYLNLSGCLAMRELPILSGSLKCLVHLDLSNCEMVNNLHEALVGLTNLQYLNLNKTRLRSLPDSLRKIRYLNLACLNKRIAAGIGFASLINNVCRNMSDLEHLNLSGNWFIYSIPESLCSMRKLHTLDLSNCINLGELPSSIGTIESLKYLYLNGCPISKVPQLGSSAISLPHLVVQPGNSDSSSNLIQLQQVDPVVLQISKLENVKSVGEAQHIKLMEKKSLYDLKLEWTGDAERFVDDKMLLEKLEPPSTLKKLEISGYNGVIFPAWLVRDQLLDLESLVFRGMLNLEEWNTSYSSGEEHMLDKLEIHDCPLLRMKPLPPKAKNWVISNSDNVLSSWEECTRSHINASTSYNVLPFFSWDTRLSVQYCKVPLRHWRLLEHLPGIHSLSIHSCGDLTGSPENMRPLKKLLSLQLSSCKSMASLPHWLGELTSLQELELRDCKVLRSLPESIQQLTRLKTLAIILCPQLTLVVESEEGKMKTTHKQKRVCLLPRSLKTLKILGCNGIKSLPEGMEQLTKLQYLEIRECPELKKWCKLEGNKMKLAHIENKEFYSGI